MSIKFCVTDDEIIESFQNSIPVCECNAQMEVDDCNDLYICPSCGLTVNQRYYDTHHQYLELVRPYVINYDDLYDEYDDEDVPEGCADCGNPAYPQCKASCSLFDY